MTRAHVPRVNYNRETPVKFYPTELPGYVREFNSHRMSLKYGNCTYRNSNMASIASTPAVGVLDESTPAC